MAYKGLSYPIIAEVTDITDNIPTLENAVKIGKAISISIRPNYEDISEYSEMNDLEFKQSLTYAELEVNVTEIPDTGETLMGNILSDDAVDFYDITTNRTVSLFFCRKKTSGYEATWLYKCQLWTESTDATTKAESITFGTPTLMGRCYPLDNGKWKTTKTFSTKAEAVQWIDDNAISNILLAEESSDTVSVTE